MIAQMRDDCHDEKKSLLATGLAQTKTERDCARAHCPSSGLLLDYAHRPWALRHRCPRVDSGRMVELEPKSVQIQVCELSKVRAG